MPSIILGVLFGFGGTWHFGYLESIINPTEDVFREFTNSSFLHHYSRHPSDMEYRIIWAITVSAPIFAGVIGCLISPLLADRYGRKRTIIFSGFLTMLLTIPCGLAKVLNSFEVHLIGRFLVGISCNVTVTLEFLLMSELSSKRHRGLAGGLLFAMNLLGQLVGSVIALPNLLGTAENWPLLYFIDTIPTLLMLCIGLPMCHESPLYLVSQGMENEARISISAYRGGSQTDVSAEIQEIKEDLALRPKPASFKTLWKAKKSRLHILTGCLANLATAFSGSYALLFFATGLLEKTGFSQAEAAMANVGIMSASLPGAILALIFLDKLGRRPMLLCGNFVLVLLNAGVMLIMLLSDKYEVHNAGFILLGCGIALMFTYGAGPGTLSAFLTTELVPYNLRATTQSLAMLIRRLSAFAMGSSFFVVYGKVGAWSFLLYIFPLLTIAVYLTLALPESKNRTVEAVQRKGPPVKKLLTAVKIFNSKHEVSLLRDNGFAEKPDKIQMGF